MKATELRLGNYLKGQNTVRITKIFNEDTVGIGKGDPYNVSHETPCLTPVLLTEEWLLKFGFKKQSITNNYDLWVDTWNFRYWSDGKRTEFRLLADGGYDEHGEWDLIEKCKYVHQLQNLYFALTGQELIIK